MEPHKHRAWVEQLVGWAQGNVDVVGMIGAGSTGDAEREADQFSDHDVLVFTRDGAAAALRSDLSWLPDPERIVYVHVETVHGRGVIYDDGHLFEVAVIDGAELEVIRLNEYSVLVDKAGLASRLETVADRTEAEAQTDDPDGVARYGHFLQDMIVGVNRYARGERLSGNSRIRGRATSNLLSLLGNPADNLDPHRRFEAAHPALARRLDAALDAPLPVTARELAAIAREELPKRLDVATTEILDVLVDLVEGLLPSR
ncbi:MAG: hypothetical protein QNJ81_03755 [Acidimicrobiia bacterium]|nr:hypothetical protein [Acidimicrobiia bacterium]